MPMSEWWLRSLERDEKARTTSGIGRRGAEISRFSAEPGEDGRSEDAVARGALHPSLPAARAPRWRNAAVSAARPSVCRAAYRPGQHARRALHDISANHLTFPIFALWFRALKVNEVNDEVVH